MIKHQSRPELHNEAKERQSMTIINNALFDQNINFTVIYDKETIQDKTNLLWEAEIYKYTVNDY